MIYDDETPRYTDARRVLLRTMREVQTVSDRLADLVSPWEAAGSMDDFGPETISRNAH